MCSEVFVLKLKNSTFLHSFVHEMRLFSDFVKIYRGLHIIFTKKFFFSLANVSDLSNKSALYCSGGKWGVFATWWHLDGRQIIFLIIFIFPALSESEIWPGHDKHGSTALQLQLVISSISILMLFADCQSCTIYKKIAENVKIYPS